MKKKELLIIFILGFLLVGEVFFYSRFILKNKGVNDSAETPADCQRTVTELIINTDERPALIEDWIYCFEEECIPASNFLNECNGKKISLQGKLNVTEIHPYCSLNAPCVAAVIAEIHGIVLHKIDDDVKKRYKDTTVHIEGILDWIKPDYGPIIDVTEIKRVY